MRALAIVAGLIIGWFVTVLLVVIAEAATGAEFGAVGSWAAVAGGVGLAVLLARLVPRSPRAQRRRIDTERHTNQLFRRD